jgi:hypothetical protein
MARVGELWSRISEANDEPDPLWFEPDKRVSSASPEQAPKEVPHVR